MSELVDQAHGLINAASKAIAASTRVPPSATTAMLARIIVSEAKKQRRNNPLLQSIDLDGDSLDWDHITAVRLKVEENQLVDVFGEIGFHIDGLKGA